MRRTQQPEALRLGRRGLLRVDGRGQGPTLSRDLHQGVHVQRPGCCGKQEPEEKETEK